MNLLQGSGLCLSLGGQMILERMDIQLRPGEILGLIGPNGAGKSSLLKILAGLIPPDSGTLLLQEQPFATMPPHQRARCIAWLAQQGEVNWPLTVEKLIELGRTPHLSQWRKPTPNDWQIIEQVLEQTDLKALRWRRFDTLSGGERARVLLARALAAQPNILLVDEPVAALDLAHQLDVMSLLSSYCNAGRGVIVVLHDLSLAAHFCHRLQLLNNGRLLAVGSAESVLSPEHLLTAYQIRPRKTAAGDPFAIPWQRIDGPGEIKP